ncbi:MAG: hypothetical protein GX216_08875 [Methanomicrobiales archaeon]|nr:hypothetical protein [Methanomicrobiales archaeon]
MEKHRQEQVDHLLCDLDFPALYRGYRWKSDTWERGFPEIFRLEREVTAAARDRTLGPDHAREIARWGGLPAPERIGCADPLSIALYFGGSPAYWLVHVPANTIQTIEWRILGFGPAYASKLLRFAIPCSFGAIDTRLVRVFGRGDPGACRYPLLDLIASPIGSRWEILSVQPGWPGEYGVWTEVLRMIARRLNRDEICCPHPAGFVSAGLRSDGIWAAADVEMALSSYASGVV